MTTLILDGSKIKNRDQLYDAVVAQLALPEWQGRNLDALYDTFTDWHEELVIRIQEKETLKKHLGDYYDSLMGMLCELTDESEYVFLEEV